MADYAKTSEPRLTQLARTNTSPYGLSMTSMVLHDQRQTKPQATLQDQRPPSVRRLTAQLSPAIKRASATAVTPMQLHDYASVNYAQGRPPSTMAVNQPPLQLQKAEGWYRLSKSGNFRNENVNHTVQRNLPEGTIVKVIAKGARVSNFKAGWVRNEHSWSKIPLQNQTGWLEDGKLSNTAKQGLLTPAWRVPCIGAT